MKKLLSIMLAVIAVVMSVGAIILSVKALKLSKDTNAALNILLEEAASKEVDSNQSEIDKAIADYIASQNDKATQEENDVDNENIEETKPEDENTEETSEENTVENNEENNEENNIEEQEEQKPSFYISEEERQRRVAEQAKIQEAREFLYSQPRSAENAYKINMYDKMMIDNNTVNFTNKALTLIGDSITVGIGASTDGNGEYREYANDLKHIYDFSFFNNTSEGGWLYSGFAGDEYSILAAKEEKFYVGSDIMILYAGVNDYLCDVPNKRMGKYSRYDKSTAGFCGDFETICTFLSNYFTNTEIFVVLNYPVNAVGGGSFEVPDEPHSYDNFIEAEKFIAQRHGFNVIDLNSIGLLDATKADMKKFMYDDVHPNDEGHRLIAEHIAAEISYVIGKKQ